MIELVLRTTESSGLVKEQILARLDGGQALPDADPILEYSGLCIDSLRHQASYQGQEISLTENYEFHTPGVPCQSAGQSLYERTDLSGSLERGAGGCKQRSILCHWKYPPEAEKGYKERIYPDRVGSRIQICGCPRGVSPWDYSV